MKKISKTISVMLAVVLMVTAFGVTDVSAASTAKLVKPKISVKTSGRYDVTVRWNTVKGADKYLIYRSTKKYKSYKLVTRIAAGTTSYHSDTMSPGKYYFKVKCIGKVKGKDARSEFSKIKKVRIRRPGNGNDSKYALSKAGYNGKLKDKRLVFVGSSLTAGSRAKNVSFVDYLAKRTGCSVVKNAIGGTTTARNGSGKDFVTRSVALIKKTKCPDLFLCQMSANDATKGIKLGKVTPAGTPMEKFDTTTVAGAMEYIICYSDKYWGCPIVFYTAMKLDNPRYKQMISLLKQIQKKWDIGVIDLYHGLGKYSIKAKTYRLYMHDRLHPFKAGYMKWVTPYFESRIPGFLKMPMRSYEPPTDTEEPVTDSPTEEVTDPTEPTGPTDSTEDANPPEPDDQNPL